MASSVVTPGEVGLDLDLVWNIVGEISKPLQAELRASIDESDQYDASFIKQHLATYYPPVFRACDAIEQTYADANIMITAQASRVIAVARSSLALETKREAGDHPENKKAPKRNKGASGFKPAGFDAYRVSDENKRKALAQYYSKRDLWSPDEYGKEWLHNYVIPANKLHPEDVLCQYDVFKTIYHCTGKWGMETLMDILTEAGHRAIGIRNEAMKFEDMLRYKVVTSEPFEDAP